jgi:hypothetical protein
MAIGRKGMSYFKRIFEEIRPVLTVIIGTIFLFGAVQIADAPPLEAPCLDDIPCYQIDDDGRIIDSTGRVRGLMKGNEVYTSDLEFRYRLSGRRLHDAP